MRVTPEISFRKTVTTVSASQRNRRGCKTCLCDIFNLLSEISLSLQGRTTVLKSADAVAAFKARLELWGRQVNTGIFDISNISRDFERDWARAFFFPAGCMITCLSFQEFEHHSPTTKDPWTGKQWICDPFVNKPGEQTLSMLEGDHLLEIVNDGGHKSMFETTSNLYTFWIKVKVE